MTDANTLLQVAVAELFERYPETIPVFLVHRMACPGCAMSVFETVGQAIAIYRLDSQQFMTELIKTMNDSTAGQPRHRQEGNRMSKVTQLFREHHRELANQLSKHVNSFVQGQPTADGQAFAAFLRDELLPHAAGEEAQLYPLMDEIVRAHGKPTATMSMDHEYIQDYTVRIEAAAIALAGAAPDTQNALHAQVAQLGLQLNAIFEMHLAKEERVYLPLFEQYVSEADQQYMLDAMHEGGASTVQKLDVRKLAPAQRHVTIFQTFDALGPGEVFELVNDHDPKPLYYQFAAEHAGEFTWDYAERGPQVWRVKIGKEFAKN